MLYKEWKNTLSFNKSLSKRERRLRRIKEYYAKSIQYFRIPPNFVFVLASDYALSMMKVKIYKTLLTAVFAFVYREVILVWSVKRGWLQLDVSGVSDVHEWSVKRVWLGSSAQTWQFTICTSNKYVLPGMLTTVYKFIFTSLSENNIWLTKYFIVIGWEHANLSLIRNYHCGADQCARVHNFPSHIINE